MDPRVDRDLCIGCGLCADLAPDVFALDEEGLSDVVGNVTAGNSDAVQDAADSCPTSAISIS